MADEEERWRQLRKTKGDLLKIARLNKEIEEKEAELEASKQRLQPMEERLNANGRWHGAEQRGDPSPEVSSLANSPPAPLSSNDSSVDVYAGTDDVEMLREEDVSDREDDASTKKTPSDRQRDSGSFKQKQRSTQEASEGEGEEEEAQDQESEDDKRSEGLFVTDDEAEEDQKGGRR